MDASIDFQAEKGVTPGVHFNVLVEMFDLWLKL